jgi:protein-disulfide isomerase
MQMKVSRLFISAIIVFACARGGLRASDCPALDRATLLTSLRTWMKVPPTVTIDVANSERVETTCYERVMVEFVDARQIREMLVYASPDRRFLSRDLFDITKPNSHEAPALLDVLKPTIAAQTAGSPGPSITLVVFSDFECPYCRIAAASMSQIAAADPNVRVEFRHLPLGMHPWALYAARASTCLKGTDFQKLHDFYFHNQQEITPDNVAAKTKDFVASLDIDQAQFDRCAASQESLDVVRHDVRAAALLGITSTPTIYANGKRLQNIQTVESLRADIQAATGAVVRGPASGTFLVFMRPTGKTAAPDVDRSGKIFLSQMKTAGDLVSVGHADGAEGAGYDVLTVRASDASSALKRISQSPLVANGIVTPEVVAFHQSDAVAR